MSLICLELSEDQIQPLWDVQVPGKPEPQNKAHITLIYTGKGGSVEEDRDLLVCLEKVARGQRPIVLSVSKVDAFEPSESSDGLRPIIGKVTSKPLQALRALLVEKLADAGVQFKNTFPDFSPHVTLAYQEAGESFEPFDLPIPLKLTVTSVSCLFGEHGDVQQTSVVFPLKRSRKEASRRVVRRWLAH